MKPPKCKTCGKEEWQHTCGPVVSVTMGVPPLYPQQSPGVSITVVEKRPKTVTQTVTLKARGGRGKKVHQSAAAKQAAYRARQKASA